MSTTKNNTGEGNSGNWNSGNRNSGNGNSGDGNSGDGNSGNWNSGDWNSGNRNSGDWNSGYGNSGNRNSGDWNSGYGNSTDRETGAFNTTQGKVRLFNQPTDLTWDEIDHPHFSEFYLTKWIEEKDMTDEEKKNDPNFFVRGGYLKKFDYKEAWSNFWRDTDEVNKKKLQALPNFDADIFLDITGIDVRKTPEDEEVRKAIELLTAKGKLKDGKILNQ